jgi:hypothetical protein
MNFETRFYRWQGFYFRGCGPTCSAVLILSFVIFSFSLPRVIVDKTWADLFQSGLVVSEIVSCAYVDNLNRVAFRSLPNVPRNIYRCLLPYVNPCGNDALNCTRNNDVLLRLPKRLRAPFSSNIWRARACTRFPTTLFGSCGVMTMGCRSFLPRSY